MDVNVIRHRPRRISATVIRHTEIEPECPDCPPDLPETSARCPDCDAAMVYRGIGHLRNGTHVHHFECVHSHREVHSLSIVIVD